MMNLSFAGCGFLGIYHVGVAVCFKKYAPHILLEKISGASFGAIAAASILCDLPLGEITSDVLRVVSEARRSTLGPFSPSFNIQNILLEGLEKFLPEDAHLRVNGKLHISLTRVYDGKNVIVSQFNSKEDLLQALMASAFIPVFSGLLPPKFHGVRYMDGGFSDNLPTLDENTITVSPFCGESDICPRDLSSQLFHVNVANTSIELSRQNIYRFARILFPPKPEILAKMCKQGFDDALRFLHRNNLLNCTRCLAVQSTFTVSEKLDESFEYDPQCKECKVHRQEALVANLPDTVLSIFQDAIDTANKGLVNWIFKHRGMKLLSVLSLPYTVPADIVFATITNIVGPMMESYEIEATMRSHPLIAGLCLSHVRLRYLGMKRKKRCMSLTPKLSNRVWEVSKVFMDQLTRVLYNVNMKRQQISAHINCNLAFTEYGRSSYDIESISQIPMGLKRGTSQMNFNFTLNLDEREMSGLDHTSSRTYPRTLSRRCSSLALNRGDGDDTFEHILQVTAQHEAIMAFYYMDENNKVKVTEIFDVTDTDSSALLTPEEKENNVQLEFDQDWNDPLNDSMWRSQHTLVGEDEFDQNSQFDLSEGSWDEDNLTNGDSNIFSDPESEWIAEDPNVQSKLPKPDSNAFKTPDSLPESDQQTTLPALTRKLSYVIMDHIDE